jgi:hypothetical protein
MDWFEKVDLPKLILKNIYWRKTFYKISCCRVPFAYIYISLKWSVLFKTKKQKHLSAVLFTKKYQPVWIDCPDDQFTIIVDSIVLCKLQDILEKTENSKTNFVVFVAQITLAHTKWKNLNIWGK